MAALLQTANITTTNTDVQFYQVPAGKVASFSLNLCNRTSAKVTVAVAMSTTTTPDMGDFIEYGTELLPGETLQRLGLVLGNSNYIFVRSDTSGVSVVIYGFEE